MINRLFIAGNLTREPELKNLNSGKALVVFGIAVNEKYTDGQGRKIEQAYFFDCKAFGGTADFIAKYGAKGRKIFIEGKLTQEKWQDKQDGKERSATRIAVERAQFLDWREENGGGGGASVGGTRPPPQAEQQARQPANDLTPEAEDIPF